MGQARRVSYSNSRTRDAQPKAAGQDFVVYVDDEFHDQPVPPTPPPPAPGKGLRLKNVNEPVWTSCHDDHPPDNAVNNRNRNHR